MALDLEALAADEATCTVNIGKDEVKISYRPSTITTSMVKKLKAAEQTMDVEVAAEVLSTIMAGWDVTRGGEPVPTDCESLQEVPLTLLKAVFFGIMMDAGRGEEEAPSNAG